MNNSSGNKKVPYAFLCFLLLINSAGAQQVQSLTKADKDFAASARQKGIKAAFLEVLSDSAVLFRPTAVKGREWMLKNGEDDGMLVWEPLFTVVNCTGDFGYTIGPYEYRKHGAQSELIALGHYISIWKIEAGKWKLLLDAGIAHEKAHQVTNQQKTLDCKKIRSKNSAEESLKNHEEKFSGECKKGLKQTIKSYTKYMDDDAVLLHYGFAPVATEEKVKIYLKNKNQAVESYTEATSIAPSGDLGYTYGFVTVKSNGKPQTKSVYVRIWKRKNKKNWKLAAELISSSV